MDLFAYKLDDAGKAILLGLRSYGKIATFADILMDAGCNFDSPRQVEIAISLESLELIESVSYRFPVEIRAVLSELGLKVARALDGEEPEKDTRTNRHGKSGSAHAAQ